MALALLDQISRPKVILAKSLYSQGALRAYQIAGLPDRVMAVIAFDWAIETVLKAAILQIDQSKQARDLSGDLVVKCQQVLKTHSITLPNEGLIGRVRAIRNAAQHEARIPTDNELTECRVWTFSFLNDFVSCIWGTDFERLSVAELVHDVDVRGLLVEGDVAFAKGDVRLAAGSAYGAVQQALKKARPAIVGREITAIRIPSGSSTFHSEGMQLDSQTHRAIQQSVDELRKALETTQEAALCNALGIDYTVFARLGTRIGKVFISANNQVRSAAATKTRALDLHEAAAIMAWCADIVVQIESRVDSLDAPFGVKYWS